MPKRQYLAVLPFVPFALSLLALAPAAAAAQGLMGQRSSSDRIILAQRRSDDEDQRTQRRNREDDKDKVQPRNRAVGGDRDGDRERRRNANERRERPAERSRPNTRSSDRAQERLRQRNERQVKDQRDNAQQEQRPSGEKREVDDRTREKPRRRSERPVKDQRDNAQQEQRPSGEKREVDDRTREKPRRRTEPQTGEQRDNAQQEQRPSGEKREADDRTRGKRRRETGQNEDARERLNRWRARRGHDRRRRFRDRKATVIKKDEGIEVRRRRIDRNAGASRFVESRRFRARHKRYRNRFRNGISIYARPPKGVSLDPKWYIVDSSRASYDIYLDTFLAPPLHPLERAYTLEEIVQDPEIRRYVRSVSLDTLHFELGSAEITDSELNKLEELARAMLEVIDRRPNYKFLLEGHTDATGSFETNLKLSEERAASVQIALVEGFGVPAENLEAVGYGEQYLEVETEEANARNRRVVVRGIGKLLAGPN